MHRLAPSLIGVALLLVGAGMIWRQRRAASCPRHERRAGQAAMVVAAGALLAGLVLLAYVWRWL